MFLVSQIEFVCQMMMIKNSRSKPGLAGEYVSSGTALDCQTLCSNSTACTGIEYSKTEHTCMLLRETPQVVASTCCDVYVKTCPGSLGIKCKIFVMIKVKITIFYE